MREIAEHPDVLVIGGGPAGASAAITLARSGACVVVVDRSAWPRDKVCGCCLNAEATAAIERLGLDDRLRRLGAAPLSRVRVAVARRVATLPLTRSFALSRGALDAAMVVAAVDAGASFHANTSARVIDADEPRIECADTRTGPRTILRPRCVVVADGLHGGTLPTPDRVARGSRLGVGVLLDKPHDEYADGVVHMAVARGGYVGAVRLEDGRLDVAAAMDPALVRRFRSPGEAAAEILRHAGLPPVPELVASRWRGTPLLTRRRADVARGRCFAVGDAAGYVEPFTGEGIGWAILSGSSLGRLLAEQLPRGDPASAGAAWRAEYRRRMRRQHLRCRAVAMMLRSPRLARTALGLVSLTPSLAARLAGVSHRPGSVETARARK